MEAEALAEIGTFDFNGEMTADFDDKKEMVTIVRYDSWSEDYVTRSSVTQFVWEFHEDRESTWNTVTDWHSSFTPICLLSPGIAVAQDRKVFVLPLLGNPLSGPLRHEGRITAICQIKARTLATGAADGIVKLWELAPAALSVVTDSGPVVKSGVVTDHFVKIHGLEILGENGDAYLPLHIKGEGRDVIVQTPELQSLHSVELSADGTLGIFSGDFEGAEDGGAWTFDVKDGKLLSVKSENCEWAGFNADGKQILTIQDGRLTFWNIGRDKEGRMTFEATGRILTQTGMKGAVVTGDGRRVATRSSAGEVIVWDENGKPLQSLRQAPLWQDVNLDPTAAQDFYKPVFDAKGQVLATAYGRTFVVWDVESGKPLSDPVSCAARIRSLEFSANDSTKILATLQDGSIVSWTHAFSGSGPAEADVVALRKLALAVADDRWVEEAPKLAAGTQSSSPVVAKLLEHFASQARTLGEKSTEHLIAR